MVSKVITQGENAAGAEARHELSHHRLQAILDHSPELIQLKDMQGRYVLVNRRFQELVGLEMTEIAGKTARALFAQEVADEIVSHDQQVMAAMTALEFEETIPQNGECHTYFAVRFPLLDSNGTPYALCGISTDITGRKRAENALRRSQERLALVIQGSSDGIWDWDLTSNEVYFSEQWKRMLGYSEEEVEPHFSAWERLLHPEDKERARNSLQAYLDGTTSTYALEHRLRHKDGSYRWILARGVAERDASGKPIRLAGSHVDLTAHKEAEQQLRRAYAELSENETTLKKALESLRATNEQLQATQMQLIQAAKLESVGTLAASVAHEVKNPLQTILMGLEFLGNCSPSLDGNAQLVLTDMHDAVTRANTIIREMLQLSATSDFQFKLEDLNSVVERSLSLIHSEVLATRMNVVVKLGTDLPGVRLDCGKVEQVFINLFMNSLQAMPQEGVLTVATRTRRFGEDLRSRAGTLSKFQSGDRLVIAEVRDTGTGIPEHQLPKVFDPFFTTKSAGTGTGLGLSVVSKIMDLHGGSVDIRNDPLGGTLATLIFKAEPEELLKQTVG